MELNSYNSKLKNMSRFIVAIMMIFGFGYMVTPKISENSNNKKLVKTNSITDSNQKVIETKVSEVASVSYFDESLYSSEYHEFMDYVNSEGPKESFDASNDNSSISSTPQNISEPDVKTELVITNEEKLEIPAKEDINSQNEDINSQNEDINSQKENVILAVDHSSFGTLLQKHVDTKGNVDYKAFQSDIQKLNDYLNLLESNPAKNSWSKNERLAYYINVYNAYTIKLILDNYPVSSIKDINNGKPWDKLFIKLGNTSYTLNNIENDIIRKQFREPRIHFAVNCAAASCPPLLNDAYYPNKLLAQLSERTESFVNNSTYNTITDSKLEVSKIFDWYGSDFGDVKDFISRYINVDIMDNNLTYKDYNWSLNNQ